MKKQIRQHQKRELKLQRRRMRSLRGRRLGLYIHIPFCRRKCDYCDFYSLANSEDRMRDYIRALLLNLQELAPRTEGYVLDTIYLGGGTPSILPESALKQLFKAIHKEYHLTRDCEITVEVNPDSVTPSLLRTLRHGGVNRISMGVQSAHDQELSLLNRLHTFEQAEQAVKLIRKAGFKNLNLDLIFGLPDQTMEAWQESVEAILALEPEHISMYALTLEEGTPLWQRKDELNLVSSDDQADEYLWAVNRLAELGYEQYEVSNFAKEGYRSRHNRKYWLGQEYVGVGPSAHSDFGGRRYSYVRDLEGYISGMLNGGVIVDSGNFDWTNGNFPEFTEPDQSYHGGVYTRDFGRAAYITKARVQLMRDLGCYPSAQAAFLLNHGLETLHLRMERHCQNAEQVARFLQQHGKVESVNYPTLAEGPYYQLAQKYLPSGCSGVISFSLTGGREAAVRFIDSLKLASLVVHVADVRTLVLHPASSTHRQLTDEQLVAAGIHPGMIRLSVGIEHVDDIIEDLKQALEQA